MDFIKICPLKPRAAISEIALSILPNAANSGSRRLVLRTNEFFVRIAALVRRKGMKFVISVLLLLATHVQAIEFPPLENAAANWLNVPSGKLPLTKGKSVLVFIFTRDCGNCHRSHAFVNSLREKYRDSIQIIGVHSPEFDWEKDVTRLAAYSAAQQIRYPIYLDPELKVWNALENRYWPAFFLFDKSGRHAGTFIGEIHAGDGSAVALEAALQKL